MNVDVMLVTWGDYVPVVKILRDIECGSAFTQLPPHPAPGSLKTCYITHRCTHVGIHTFNSVGINGYTSDSNGFMKRLKKGLLLYTKALPINPLNILLFPKC